MNQLGREAGSPSRDSAPLLRTDAGHLCSNLVSVRPVGIALDGPSCFCTHGGAGAARSRYWNRCPQTGGAPLVLLPK